jgi:hypothetical protein
MKVPQSLRVHTHTEGKTAEQIFRNELPTKWRRDLSENSEEIRGGRG